MRQIAIIGPGQSGLMLSAGAALIGLGMRLSLDSSQAIGRGLPGAGP